MVHETQPTKDKPFANRFMQQQLASMYPTHSPGTVTLAMFLVAIVFIPVGVAIVVVSDQIFEDDIRYDDINSCRYPGNGSYTFPFNGSTVTQGCRTVVTFRLSKRVKAPIYVYYRLKWFYQNFRTFKESVDHDQMMGRQSDGTSSCWPFRHPGEFDGSMNTPVTTGAGDTIQYGDMIYNPCGAVPWSLFNDTISIYKIPDGFSINPSNPTLPPSTSTICRGDMFNASTGESLITENQCSKKGIALRPDRNTRFQRASSFPSRHWTGEGSAATGDPFLAAGYYANEPGHRIPMTDDEDLMVWSRAAGLPDFRKLYRIIDNDLEAGDYALDIAEFYDTVGFGGEKHVVLGTTSAFGGRNFVLGIALITMGSASFVLGVAFIIITVFRKQSRRVLS